MKQLYAQTQQANSNRHDFFLGSAETAQPLGGTRRFGRITSIFPVRNKSKGPPGRAAAPGAIGSLPAAASAGSEKSYLSFKKNNKTHNQSTNIKSLSIMKKQILILLVIVLAAFANVNKSYGQYADNLTAAPAFCPTPTPIAAACVASDALHPSAGTLYSYSVTVTGTGSTIHWFVTTTTDFITNGTLTSTIENNPGTYISAAGTVAGNAAYNDGTNTVNKIDITWKSFDPGQNVFLVTYVKNADGCTDNIQVYKIEPVFTFTLDIAGLTNGGAQNTTLEDCVHPVLGAKWNGTAVDMDYGFNYVYFVVNAANFTHSWMPSFELTTTNVGANSTREVSWAYPDESYTGATTVTWHPLTATGNVYSSNTPVSAKATTGTVGAAGECIIVRVLIDHNTDQTLADISLKLAVDGVMYDSANSDYANTNLGDIHFEAGPSGTPACPWRDGYTNDYVDYTLTARPTVTSTTPDAPATGVLPFETKVN